jgi:hypothetical protein
MEATKMNIKQKLVTGALLFATGVGVGVNLMPTHRQVAELEQRVEQCSKTHLKQIQKHKKFLSQLPNYDSFGLWLDGNSYESWMVQDINANYKK